LVDDAALTIELGRARATVALGQQGSSVSVTPNPSATTAPGTCVAIPKRSYTVARHSSSIDDGGQFHSSTMRLISSTLSLLDVDGDGVPDAFVPEPRDKNTCPEAVMWRVYVTRGACGHDVGLVGPSLPQSGGPLDASGFRPLVATSETSVHGT